jgi:hypothetical protein
MLDAILMERSLRPRAMQYLGECHQRARRESGAIPPDKEVGQIAFLDRVKGLIIAHAMLLLRQVDLFDYPAGQADPGPRQLVDWLEIEETLFDHASPFLVQLSMALGSVRLPTTASLIFSEVMKDVNRTSLIKKNYMAPFRALQQLLNIPKFATEVPTTKPIVIHWHSWGRPLS